MKPMRHHFLATLLLWLACFGNAFAQDNPNKAAFGTGFLITPKGHIVTAYHTIKDMDQVLVGPIDHTGNRFRVAKVLRVDVKKDLALLQAKINGKALHITPWQQVPIGLEVYAIGYPQIRFQGISRKITQGIINGDRSASGDTGYFQFSAEIQKGNSGGPLIAPDGSVIGVARSKLNALSIAEKTKDLPQNVNYGIKSSTLLDFLRESGVPALTNSLNLHTRMRPYEIYRYTSDAVFVIIARKKSGAQPKGIHITPGT